LEAKRLGLLRELVPTAATFAVILNPQFPDFEAQAKEIQEAGRTLGVEIQILHASSERDLDLAFAKVAELRADGLLIGADPFLYGRRDYIVGLAGRSALPAIYEQRENTVAGGWQATGRISPTPTVRRASTPVESSMARSRTSCPFCSRPSLSW
jgi:putative tryptophan/tyrosine transport system substrate-binding protein